MQKRWGNKNKVFSNMPHKYNALSFILTFIFNLHLKNIFTLKKSSTFAYLLKEKPGNWFAIVKMWRRKKFYKKVSASLLKIWFWEFSVSACANQATGFSMNGLSTPNRLFQTINGLLETAPSTITRCIVPFKNRKSWTFC